MFGNEAHWITAFNQWCFNISKRSIYRFDIDRSSRIVSAAIDFNRAACNALHATRPDYEKAVCPSACLLSVKRVFRDKTKEKNGWWGDPFYIKVWVKLTQLERNRRFLVDIRSYRLSGST